VDSDPDETRLIPTEFNFPHKAIPARPPENRAQVVDSDPILTTFDVASAP